MPTYAELIKEFPLRPIRSERQLDRAGKMALRLAGAGRLSRDAEDYLDVLDHLIETHEAEHHPIDTSATPRELLEFLIEENSITVSQLADETGIVVSTLSAILNGKRALNVHHITRLAGRFRVEPGLFIERVPAGV